MAAVVPQPGSVPMDALGPPPSFSGRKGASTQLPGRIELPNNPLTAKFSGNAVPTTHTSQASINNLLTPPSNIPGESLSPISSGSNSASNPAAHGLPPYTPTGYWQPTGSGLTPYMSSAGTGTTPPSWTGSGPHYHQHPPPGKGGLFSPSLNALVRGTHPSPPTHEGVPPPNYDLGALPPFPHSLSPPQHHQLPGLNHHHQPPPNGLHYPAQSPPVNDGYQRLPPTPNQYYGSQSSTASAPASYPPYSGPSPASQSPIPRMSLSPINHQQPYARPYPQYGMHGQGPLMSNVHQQHQPMGMVGMPGVMPGFHSGHAASLQHLYNHPGVAPPNDRPFKCDQCPQSFNRNHDLKRHKRIHLAVKPFPCGHCEKSFSRKDALKRHILVKGCGKANHDASKVASDSGDDKSDSSDDERMQS